MEQYKALKHRLLDMTQAGLCHIVIGSPPESCCYPNAPPLNVRLHRCPAEARPGRTTAPVSAGSGAAVLATAKQPHLSRETALRESARPEPESGSSPLPMHVEGGEGVAREVRCSVRLPEDDRIGIRG